MKVKPIPVKYAQTGDYLYLTDRQIRLSRTAKMGTCFIGGGIPKSKLRKMSSDARFGKLDVIIRTFTSQIARLKNSSDLTRFRIEKSNAIKNAIKTFSRSDREFYFSRIN